MTSTPDKRELGRNRVLLDDSYRPMKWVVESSPAAVTRRSGKNGDFAALRRLSPDGEGLDGGEACVREGWMEVRRVLGSFILRSTQQEEALHRIWYTLRRWRLVSRRIVLFPTTACSSINRR
ncbi:unnamed protein product [Spirodela intermedia]|uniref:Uncharacterized protein n=1 Tax=Spirodela intermedia TaxID=51605 RepID=A0A7I8J770_SPIIN|nr:unnamed protein product [Spirodela intermedia]CAA6665262.1 unnamed protein product [Spirodela intermedia]